MRRVGTAGHEMQEEGHRGVNVVQHGQPVDGVVGHRRGEVPPGIVDVWIDRRGVVEEVGLPLAGVAADEAVEVLEPHAGGPLVEGPGLGRHPVGGVVVLAVPGRPVAVLEQNATDGRVVDADDAVVAGIARRLLRDDAEAHRVMVAPGNQRGPRRRTQRCRVEVGVAQAVGGDPVERRRRDDPSEGARRGEADVVGHDQENVRRVLRRHHPRRPIWRGLRCVQLDLTAEFLRRWRDIASVDRGCCVRRARHAVDLLCGARRRSHRRAGNQRQHYPGGGSHAVVSPE